LFPGEARQVERDHEMLTALIQAAEREQVLELAAVCRLRTLNCFVKALNDLVALKRQ
jgi:hypothetical protein